MEHVLLDQWQQEALDHDGHLLLCTGRQSGKTFLMSRKASKYMLEHPNHRIIVVSLTEDQAELMIIMILDYLEKNYRPMIAKGAKKPTKRRIYLKNGAMILARPVGNTGDAIRGFTGNILIIDEASRMPELAFIAAKPTLMTTGGHIWMCSTPHGKIGYFYECFLNKHNRFKVIHTNAEEIAKNRPITEVWTQERHDGALRHLDEEKLDMSEAQYRQEYLGHFIDDIRQLFTDDWIDKVCSLPRGSKSSHLPSDYFLGVDIARMGEDSSSFQIVQRTEGIIKHIESIITKKTYTTDTFDKICSLEKQWNFKQIGIDAGSGSLGVGIFDFLLRVPIVRKKVIPLDNHARMMDSRGEKTGRLLKEGMYVIMQMLGEQEKLQLLDDEKLRVSLKSVQYEYVRRAGMKTVIRIFSNPHHFSDFVEGLIRAVYLANQKHLKLQIHWI